MNVCRRLARLILFCAAPALSTPLASAADDWKPVDQSQLILKQAVVEKDADAEVLLWEVRIKDEADGGARTVRWHYMRIKIFTDRGKESQSQVDIPYFQGTRISDIAGRTIKQDGSIVELKKDAVFDRSIVKASGLKVKARSFVMPAVEPGVIIEYRYREESDLSGYLRLDFQQDIPIHRVKYYIKPYSAQWFPYGMRWMPFHAQFPPFVKERDGFYSTELTNVPALREEPRMPPEKQVGPWMLIYYSEDKKLTVDSYWKEYGKEVYDSNKSLMKANDDVKKAAVTIVGDAATPEQKLERLFDYCKTKIKNIYSDASGMTDADRSKAKENKSPSDTLKRGMGTTFDIDMLFAALAASAGFDARFAKLADRSDIFFDPAFSDSYFLRTYDVAVKLGSEWRFFDPGSPYTSFGMLLWQEEGNQALVTDPKEPVFVRTPVSDPEKSLEKRTAKLTLSEDGTLEGDVRIEYTGHLAVEKKSFNDEDSPEEREKTLVDMIRRRMSTAELTNIRIENVTDPSKPFVYSFRVRVSGYAQRTGKRLFLQPAFFQRGVSPVFASSERKHQIYFHYPWSESDDVTISLPAGFSLENADAPGPLTVSTVGKYDVKILSLDGGKALEYKRDFYFGAGGSLLFPPSTYPQLKRVFDEFHQRDNHTITLRQGASAN